MKGKILRTEDGVVVTLPDETLDLLGVPDGGEVAIAFAAASRRVVIAPEESDLPEIDAEFDRRVTAFLERYRPALKKLAE